MHSIDNQQLLESLRVELLQNTNILSSLEKSNNLLDSELINKMIVTTKKRIEHLHSMTTDDLYSYQEQELHSIIKKGEQLSENKMMQNPLTPQDLIHIYTNTESSSFQISEILKNPAFALQEQSQIPYTQYRHKAKKYTEYLEENYLSYTGKREEAEQNMTTCIENTKQFFQEIFDCVEEFHPHNDSNDMMNTLISTFYEQTLELKTEQDFHKRYEALLRLAFNVVRKQDNKTLNTINRDNALQDIALGLFEIQRFLAINAAFRLDLLSQERKRAADVNLSIHEWIQNRGEKIFQLEEHSYKIHLSTEKIQEHLGAIPNKSGEIYYKVLPNGETKYSVIASDLDAEPGILEKINGAQFGVIEYTNGKKENNKNIVFAYRTSIKTPVSTVQKEVRKQSRFNRDINRFLIGFFGQVENPAELQRIILTAFIPMKRFETNLESQQEKANEHSSNDFNVQKGIVKLPHPDGEVRAEIQVSDITNFLTASSDFHQTGHKQYRLSRIMKGLVPKLFPQSIYTQNTLATLYSPIIQQAANKRKQQDLVDEKQKFIQRTQAKISQALHPHPHNQLTTEPLLEKTEADLK